MRPSATLMTRSSETQRMTLGFCRTRVPCSSSLFFQSMRRGDASAGEAPGKLRNEVDFGCEGSVAAAAETRGKRLRSRAEGRNGLRPRVTAPVRKLDVLQAESPRGGRHAERQTASSGQSAEGRPGGQSAPPHVHDRAGNDAHHVVKEAIAAHPEIEAARIVRGLGDTDLSEGAYRVEARVL